MDKPGKEIKPVAYIMDDDAFDVVDVVSSSFGIYMLKFIILMFELLK
jgi:hypothetical protein